jgi:hypothetical protein
MTDEKMSPLRERMIPSRDIAEQYPAGQWKTCAFTVWVTKPKRRISERLSISPGS